jgi:hypothetical protein
MHDHLLVYGGILSCSKRFFNAINGRWVLHYVKKGALCQK